MTSKRASGNHKKLKKEGSKVKYSKLFSPIQIRGVTFPNRVIQSAMGTLMVGVDKKINQTVTDFLTARAKGGVGLVYSQ